MGNGSSPIDPLWIHPKELLAINRLKDDWCSIDGIPTKTASRRHHHWVAIGKGREIWRNRRYVLEAIRDHLEIDEDSWRDLRPFLVNFAGAFLSLSRHLVVSVHALPQRKTFTTLFNNDNSSQAQRIIYPPSLLIPESHISDTKLELGYGITIRGHRLRIRAEKLNEDKKQTPYWTKLALSRSVPGGSTCHENIFFMAHEKDRNRIRETGSVPILERYFNQAEQIQKAAIVSFNAISPNGRLVHTHEFNVCRISGIVLDIRQSQPSLEHLCRSAPHNHSALRRLVYGHREDW